ncbi:polysaccharide deacetylase family protein [bacterium AH-315-C20]|nr:polysaccharide deacetylase family protein [bacterium AH-315-C20]
MRLYTVPKWLRLLYPDAIWDYPSSKNTIYLTFDDGPSEISTLWLLELLADYNAQATFFCVGKKAEQEPELLDRIRSEGHLIGNHSYSHMHGLKVADEQYFEDMKKGAEICHSKLYRPPYGKIRSSQFKYLQKEFGYQAVFWSVMSYDYDVDLSSEDRMNKIRKLVRAGSVVVFHDSEKAFPQLKNELPILLKEWTDQGFNFKIIPIK